MAFDFFFFFTYLDRHNTSTINLIHTMWNKLTTFDVVFFMFLVNCYYLSATFKLN